MQRDDTDWTGVAFGISLACLVAFQQFKLPPVLPRMIATYGWDRTLAGGFMAVYAVAGLAFSLPIGRAMQRRGIMGMLFGSLALLILLTGFPARSVSAWTNSVAPDGASATPRSPASAGP